MVGQIALAGGSIFGISKNTVGILNQPYSASGLARSYAGARSDSLQLNFLNYALWTNISRTTYSVRGHAVLANSKDGQNNNNFHRDMNFQGAMLAFPILPKKLIAGAGIQPFTSIDQRIEGQFSQSDIELDKSLYIAGGLNRILLNMAYRIKKDLSLSAGYEYTFGEITDKYRLLNAGTTISNIQFNYAYRFYGHGAVLAAAYNYNDKWNLGTVYRHPVHLEGRLEAIDTNSEFLENKDTKADYTLPAQYIFGAEYLFSRRWALGMDVIYQDWENGFLVNNQSKKGFAKHYRVGVGAERATSPKIFTDLKDKMEYRFGLFAGNINYKSAGNSVNEYGLSLGFSLPIKRFRSRFDFATRIGIRGSTDANQYEENFAEMSITISANELWFVNIQD